MQRQATILGAVSEHTPTLVVEATRWLAREVGGRVVLAHAFDEMGIAVPSARDLAEAGATSEDLADHERRRARARLEDAAEGLAGVEHTTVLADGLPVPVLVRLAAEQAAALLVAGTAARGALDRILIGSVAGELAAAAPCPVVVVPAGAALQAAGPVVAGHDGSDDSTRAARHAARLAAALGRELVLVRVAGDDDPPVPELDGARVAVEQGDPAEGLARAARERDAALLVTGTRGRGAVASALLGSVSSEVIRHGGRPVVLVGPAAGPAA